MGLCLSGFRGPECLFQQSAVIPLLAAQTAVGRAAVDAASLSLGVSRRQVYVLIKRYREGSGLLTDLTPGRCSGGKGTSRLSGEVDALVREMVRKQYLTRQKRTLAAVHRDIAAACRVRGLPVPARNTMGRRIQSLNPVEVGRHRGGPNAVRPLQSASGDVPVIDTILEQVQIDHAVIDVIVVDERERQPIGRPYLTAAIAVRSRSLVGMVVTLEAPSAVSVGLCLAHAGTDKRPWPEGLLGTLVFQIKVSTCPELVAPEGGSSVGLSAKAIVEDGGNVTDRVGA